MEKTQYGYRVKTRSTFDEAVTQATEALAAEGFGILTEIDVRATLKKKINLDFRRYLILGACNPHLASRMLAEELDIGLLMPCNAIVYENDDGTATVSLLSAKAMADVTGRDDLTSIVDEAEERILCVVSALDRQIAV